MLKFMLEVYGAMCVMMVGDKKRQMWPAGSWGFQAFPKL